MECSVPASAAQDNKVQCARCQSHVPDRQYTSHLQLCMGTRWFDSGSIKKQEEQPMDAIVMDAPAKVCRLCEQVLPEDKKKRRLHHDLCIGITPKRQREDDTDDDVREPISKRRRIVHRVEAILGHVKNEETGQWEFKVQWAETGDETVEPMSSFVDTNAAGEWLSVTDMWADYVEAVGLAL
jgi:hypothetical protein